MNKCKRCGCEWVSRVKEVKACPKCKSYYWKEERKKKEYEKNNHNSVFI